MAVDNNEPIAVELVLSPGGQVYLDLNSKTEEKLSTEEYNRIQAMFSKGCAAGLLHLGIQEFSTALPTSFQFWRKFSRQYMTHICKLLSSSEDPKMTVASKPDRDRLDELIDKAPFIKGIEYISIDILNELWAGLESRFLHEIEQFESPQNYLQYYNSNWNLVRRVCFHLAENKKDENKPFAFLATYTTQLSQHASMQHLPLKRALQDYAGEKNHSALLSLLLPVQKTASQSQFVKNLVDKGTIFQATTWTAREAHSFLKDIPLMEANGVIVKVPNWWNAHKPIKPKVVVTVGDNVSSMLGLDTLLDFNIHLALSNGEKLSSEEWQAILNSASDGNLVKIKGQWVEIDKEKLQSVLGHWNQIQKAAKNGLSMAESLRLLAGAGSNILSGEESSKSEAVVEWSTVKTGDWLKNVLIQLRDPQNIGEGFVESTLKSSLQGELRPYQLSGVQWMWLLYQLKLGGCLADDMGLGKTIQVLSLLLLVKAKSQGSNQKTHLLVVPASLLGNWQAEMKRFAPSLQFLIAHASVNKRDVLNQINIESFREIDVVVTTYAAAQRLPWMKEIEWDLFILDEAQQIKNPGTKQTRAVKEIKGQVRLILTGTPIENRLGDLWSLFDFAAPGLLGTSKVFSEYTKKACKDSSSSQYERFMSTLRGLTQPYILRRLKSDKRIIADLPDKTEVQTFCSLSKEQLQLYQQAVQELALKLKEAQGVERRGLVLSYLLRFKQICNHPSQWLGYGDYNAEASGKFLRLQEICEEIASKQEKVLVFTQFREIIPAIATFLSQVFGKEGLILHGDVPINKRAELVDRFQQEQGPPFFVLSIKAGGTGLTLTKASHVIHFDRWWNPAVENQATDRAYRIGQKHPVLVHKFVCQGTIEEKIDHMISMKKNLSKDILEGGREVSLTEMTDEELLDMISLDIYRAQGD